MESWTYNKFTWFTVDMTNMRYYWKLETKTYKFIQFNFTVLIVGTSNSTRNLSGK